MDGLYWKTLPKWMIWGYHHFRKHPEGKPFFSLLFFGWGIRSHGGTSKSFSMATATSPLVGSIDGRTCGEAQRAAQTKTRENWTFICCLLEIRGDTVLHLFCRFFSAHNTLGIQALTMSQCHLRKSRVLVKELLASIMTSEGLAFWYGFWYPLLAESIIPAGMG